MSTFLTAAEAFEQTKEVIKRKTQEQLATLGWLERKIKERIADGKNYYTFRMDENLTDDQISALRTVCYIVELQRDKVTSVIWPHK